MNLANTTGTTKKVLTFTVAFIAIASTLGFSGCGKKNNGGPALQNPGPIGLANQCTGGVCFGAASGQTLGRAIGRLFYPDSLDQDEDTNFSSQNRNNSLNNNQNNNQIQFNGGRLMEITATINMWQTAQGTNRWGNVQNVTPYQRFGNTLSGQQLMYIYVGGVQISGNLQVFQQIAGCNFPTGNYALQGNGVIGMDNTYLQNGAILTATQNGYRISMLIDHLQVQSMQAMTNNNQTYDAVLKGVVEIEECNNSSFKVE